mgnify:CR=1 FL=1
MSCSGDGGGVAQNGLLALAREIASHVLRADIGQHHGRNVAGESAGFFGVTVLATDENGRPLEGPARGVNVCDAPF